MEPTYKLYYIFIFVIYEYDTLFITRVIQYKYIFASVRETRYIDKLI